jgi:putative transposase
MEAHQIATPGLVKVSTLARIFSQNGLIYKKLKGSAKQFRRFQAEHPNQIWQSDVMYGPYLPDPKIPEKKKQTFLVAVLDDFSRLIPHAQFYWHEKLPCLEWYFDFFNNERRHQRLKNQTPAQVYLKMT